MPENRNPSKHTGDILVVDDEISSLRLLTEILEKEGYKVRPSESPAMAIESAMAYPPDLILLDVNMPEMNGYEVCRLLKKDERTSDIPIIFVSSLHDVHEKIKGFEAGGVDFVSKPYQELEVLARVKTHLNLYYMQMHLEDMVSERTAELIKAHDNVRRSEERFRETFEQAAVGISHVSTEGHFLRINKKFCDIVGYPKKEMLKLTFQDITYPDDLEADLEQARRILSGQSSTYAMEKRYKRKNGEIVWVHLTVSLLREDSGTPKYFIAAVKDISDRKKVEIQLQKYQQRLKALAFQLTIAEEKERRRIATDLHDQVGQSLAFARIQISAAQKLDVEDRLKTKLDDISATLMETIQETRYLVFELSSPFMNEIGLGAAICEWLEDHIEKRHHLKTEFIDEIDESLRKTLDNNIRAIIFRNVRELLINVVKHATAEKVQVTLKNTAEMIKVTVLDDGVGFDPGKMDQVLNQEREFGLFSIQERMTDLGGSLEIVSEPGKGCRAILTVPIETKLEE